MSSRTMTSFFGAEEDSDDDKDDKDTADDGSSNAFTFSLLGQLKDSLVTYDNSLKGFLDVGKAAVGGDGAEGKDDQPITPVTSPTASGSAARDRIEASIEMEKQLEDQRKKYQEELAEAKSKADEHMKAVLEEEDRKRVAKIKEMEENAKKLAAEKQEMEGTVMELESIKMSKQSDEKKIQQLQRGWAMEREQGELVKMAMVNQHKQELEAVRASGRQKMAAMQTELVQTMEMLEKMYNGWQNSLEDALTEMRIASEAERKKAVESARQAVLGELEDSRVNEQRLQEMYQTEHTRRKMAHNKLVELMGNIRVICRVRPINKTEIKSGLGQDCTAYPTEGGDETIIVKTPVHAAVTSSKKGKKSSETSAAMTINPDDPGQKFEFDTVFGPDSTQLQVFNELKPLVTSCMDGFSVTIFAYGQTGSGKTYTMEGGDQPDGLCYRAFEELFSIRDQRCESGRMAYSIRVSMLEIYNEQVRDLLNPRAKDATSPKSLDIRATPTGSDVPGLTSFEVHTPAEVHDLMLKGNASRAVGGHSMNERSSRSHSCIRITIAGENMDKGTMINAKLYLIDLAGSERVSKTDASGDRLKEAQNINKSLSALGNVMQALGKASKQGNSSGGAGGAMKHVPFRDSKLTYLLQDSLSGGSKVLMVVNASPAAYNHSETISSLNFASRCRAIELGKATKHEESGEAVSLKREVIAMRKELDAAKKTAEEKSTALFEAEKREMALSQQMSDVTSKTSSEQEALAAQHQKRTKEMMDERERTTAALESVREDLSAATASLEGKEEDLAAAQEEVRSLHEELMAAKEAKVSAEGTAMGMGIELKNVQRELEKEREKAGASESSTVSALKSKLAQAEKREHEVQDEAARASAALAEAQREVEKKEQVIVDLTDELNRGRAEYSALLTKMTMDRYGGGGGGDEGGGGEASITRGEGQSVARGTNVASSSSSLLVSRPLLTDESLASARLKAPPSRLPRHIKAASKGSALALPQGVAGGAVRLFRSSTYQAAADGSGVAPPPIPTSDAGSAAFERLQLVRGASLSRDPGSLARALSNPRARRDSAEGHPLSPGSAARDAESNETKRNIEARRAKMAELAKLAAEEEAAASAEKGGMTEGSDLRNSAMHAGGDDDDDEEEDEDEEMRRSSHGRRSDSGSNNSSSSNGRQDRKSESPRRRSSSPRNSSSSSSSKSGADKRSSKSRSSSLSNSQRKETAQPPAKALTGDDDATDAEFAKFQAQCVGGVSLVVVMVGTGAKARRRPKVFAIRFVPKKGLTLVWSKRDSVVLSSVTQVVLGPGQGPVADVLAAASPRPSSNAPRNSVGVSAVAAAAAATAAAASTPAVVGKGAGGQASITHDKLFSLRYNTSGSSSSSSSSDVKAAAAVEASSGTEASPLDLLAPTKTQDAKANLGPGEAMLVLETTSSKQRDELARCFRRLAQQERERSSFLSEV